MSKLLGANQLAECARCGQKGLARDLVPDGRNPQLLVFADCWDPPHESERPFTPSDTEGMPRYPIAPELLPDGAAALAAESDVSPPAWEPEAWETSPAAWLEGTWSEGAGVVLTWTRATTIGARFERYEIFRSVDGAAFSLRATNTIAYSLFGGVTNEPEGFTNLAPPVGTLRYYVEAVAGNGRRVRSNTVTIVSA